LADNAGRAGVQLTPKTERRVELLFPPGDREVVRVMLRAECGANIPGWESAGLERLHFAVLKISGGDLGKLDKAIDLAKRDFRDALVQAGFGEPDAHSRWRPAKKR
jgi:hypothetical protein